MDQSNQAPKSPEDQEKQAIQKDNVALTKSEKEQNQSDQATYRTEQPFTGDTPVNTGPAAFSKPDNTKLFCILSYFSVLWLLGLLIDPDHPKVRFHVNQGILLSIFSAAYSLIMTILNAAFTYLPFMFIFTTLLSVLGGVAVLGLMVWGIVNAAQDKEEPLPVFGSLYTFIK